MTTSTTSTKMTQRSFYEELLTHADSLPAHLIAYASEQIEKLTAKNSSASSKRKQKADEANAPIMEAIVRELSTRVGGLLTSELAEVIGESTSKTSAIARKMAEVGTIVSEEVKIPKVGKRIRYRIA